MWQSFLEFYKANSAFSSTVLGIVIAVLTFYLRERYNRKRILRKVLCHLLNLYWCQSRLIGLEKTMREGVSKVIQNLIEDLFPDTAKQEANAVIKELEPMIIQTIGLSQSHFNYPTDSFIKDLEELSKEFPVLAYQLRGTEGIAQLHHSLFDHVKNFLTGLEAGDSEDFRKATMLENEDPLETLEAGIRITARKSSWLTYVKVRFRILPKAKSAISLEALQEHQEKLRKNAREYIKKQIRDAEANEPTTAT